MILFLIIEGFAQNFSVIISLHLRSMWEPICDAVASWSGWKFGSKFWECPTLRTESPPPPENWNLGRSWHFEFWLWLGILPPPPKVQQTLKIEI